MGDQPSMIQGRQIDLRKTWSIGSRYPLPLTENIYSSHLNILFLVAHGTRLYFKNSYGTQHISDLHANFSLCKSQAKLLNKNVEWRLRKSNLNKLKVGIVYIFSLQTRRRPNRSPMASKQNNQ